MNTKHTPGPWIAQPDPDSIYKDDWCIGVDGMPVDYVATCSERDARPISAVPELLRVAELAVKLNPQINYIGSGMIAELVERAKAAIAKATGENI